MTFTAICHATLATLIEKNDVIIIDVRSFKSYEKAHVKGAMRVLLSGLLMRRLANGKIPLAEVLVDNLGTWKNRSPDTIVCVYDDHSSSEEMTYSPKNPLHVITKALEAQSISSVFLQGGYTSFSQNQSRFVVQGEQCPKESPCSGKKGLRPASLTCLLKAPCSSSSSAPKPKFSSCKSIFQDKSSSRPPSTPRCGLMRFASRPFSSSSSFETATTTTKTDVILTPGQRRISACHSAPQRQRRSLLAQQPQSQATAFPPATTEGGPVASQPQSTTQPKASLSSSYLSVQCPSPSPRTTKSKQQRLLEEPISKITKSVFIGAERDAANYQLLKSLSITHVVNVTEDIANFHESQGIQYYRIPIKDTWNQRLREHFGDGFRFIDEAVRSGGRVLVHCRAGVSRSPAVVIGYLMHSQQLQLRSSHNLVREKREIINPNLDFMGELKEYEASLEATAPLPQAICCS